MTFRLPPWMLRHMCPLTPLWEALYQQTVRVHPVLNMPTTSLFDDPRFWACQRIKWRHRHSQRTGYNLYIPLSIYPFMVLSRQGCVGIKHLSYLLSYLFLKTLYRQRRGKSQGGMLERHRTKIRPYAELWCWRSSLESPLDCKEIKRVNPKGNQSWIFIGRT